MDHERDEHEEQLDRDTMSSEEERLDGEASEEAADSGDTDSLDEAAPVGPVAWEDVAEPLDADSGLPADDAGEDRVTATDDVETTYEPLTEEDWKTLPPSETAGLVSLIPSDDAPYRSGHSHPELISDAPPLATTREANIEHVPWSVSPRQKPAQQVAPEPLRATNPRLNPTSDGGPPLARPIVLVSLDTEQARLIVEQALAAAHERDKKTLAQIAEDKVKYAFWAHKCEQNAVHGTWR